MEWKDLGMCVSILLVLCLRRQIFISMIWYANIYNNLIKSPSIIFILTFMLHAHMIMLYQSFCQSCERCLHRGDSHWQLQHSHVRLLTLSGFPDPKALLSFLLRAYAVTPISCQGQRSRPGHQSGAQSCDSRPLFFFVFFPVCWSSVCGGRSQTNSVCCLFEWPNGENRSHTALNQHSLAACPWGVWDKLPKTLHMKYGRRFKQTS